MAPSPHLYPSSAAAAAPKAVCRRPLRLSDAKSSSFLPVFSHMPPPPPPQHALVLVAEWSWRPLTRDVRFLDDNMRSCLKPVIGGDNVPALDELLRPNGLALGDAVVSGEMAVAPYRRYRFM